MTGPQKTLGGRSSILLCMLALYLLPPLKASSPPPPQAGATTPLQQPTAFFPLEQVRRGLRGTAYTVFEGTTPEAMEVEILGVLRNAIGPGQDMILARLRGAKPEYTGVVAGMSGSPVYMDGKLLGALSYRIGQFSKDPIAGITPIAQMLQVRDTPAQTGSGPMSAKVDSSDRTLELVETPLVFGGFGQEAIDRFGDRFRTLGLLPVAGLGGRNAGASQPEPLVPGSAVSAVLVDGDLSITGTCTVTYVDPKRLLACGHPITQYGNVDIPMTKAEVVATLASPLNAFKIVNATETVGAFTEDRASAILGVFGAHARMIPVSVHVGLPEGEREPATTGGANPRKSDFHLQVLDNPQLTPSAMLVSVFQTLQGTNTSAAEMSYRMHGELEIGRRDLSGAVEPLPPVPIDGLMTQNDFNSASINAALLVNDRFSRIYGNPLDRPVIAGLRLEVTAIPERMSASLESARLSRAEARAGETVEVEAVLRPYRKEARTVRLLVRLPESLSPGAVRVLVSDAASLDRLASIPSQGSQQAEALPDIASRLRRLHTNDRVYVTLLDRDPQALLGGAALAEIPLSMANIFQPLKDTQRLQLNGESLLEAGSLETGYALTGSQVLTLTVR